MHCPNCGAPVQDSDKFCRFCGKSLPAPTLTPTPTPTPTAEGEENAAKGDLFGFPEGGGAPAENAQPSARPDAAPAQPAVPPAQPNYAQPGYGQPYGQPNYAQPYAPPFERKINKFGIAGFILSLISFVLIVSAFVSVYSILMSDTSWIENGGYISESMLMEIGASFLALSAFSLLTGVLAVCFSGIGKRNASMYKLNGFATAGLVIGCVSLGITVLFYFVSFI